MQGEGYAMGSRRRPCPRVGLILNAAKLARHKSEKLHLLLLVLRTGIYAGLRPATGRAKQVHTGTN
jgi:hypothetical protein